MSTSELDQFQLVPSGGETGPRMTSTELRPNTDMGQMMAVTF
jgi:hypothetical protein